MSSSALPAAEEPACGKLNLSDRARHPLQQKMLGAAAGNSAAAKRAHEQNRSARVVTMNENDNMLPRAARRHVHANWRSAGEGRWWHARVMRCTAAVRCQTTTRHADQSWSAETSSVRRRRQPKDPEGRSTTPCPARPASHACGKRRARWKRRCWQAAAGCDAIHTDINFFAGDVDFHHHATRSPTPPTPELMYAF